MIQGFNMMKISTKLWLLVVMFFAVLIGSNVLDLLSAKQRMLAEKQLKTRHLVESAFSVLTHFQAQAKAGSLADDDARQAAIKAVRALRYEEKEYFWINDMGRPAPKMIMHPTVPALDGKVLDDAKFNKATSFMAGTKGQFEPLKNQNLFVAFVDVVEKSGHGFVTYDWPKPLAAGGASTELFPKLSYVKKFEPWGWVIGSGIYIDDLDAAFWADMRFGLLKIACWIGLLGFLSWAVGRGIIGPIDTTASAMDDIAKGDGNLSMRLKPAAAGSMARLADSFNSFVSKIDLTVGHVDDSTARLASVSAQLSTVADRTASGVRKQEAETNTVAASVSEMSNRAKQVEESAANASAAAARADREASAGKLVVDQAIAAIRLLATNVSAADDVIESLKVESGSIGSIVDVIREVAGQTNLLALNAAIEAARAGEQGRGFAVVADEVRILAQRTQDATQQIQRKIENLQKNAQHAASVMAESRERADRSVEQAAGAGESLGRITEAVTTISQVNVTIASMAKEQTAQARHINEHLGAIQQVSQQTAEDAAQTQQATAELVSALSVLQGLVKQFKLSPHA